MRTIFRHLVSCLCVTVSKVVRVPYKLERGTYYRCKLPREDNYIKKYRDNLQHMGFGRATRVLKHVAPGV